MVGTCACLSLFLDSVQFFIHLYGHVSWSLFYILFFKFWCVTGQGFCGSRK